MSELWERAVGRLAPAEYINALGALTLFYNDLEFGLYGVLGCFLPEAAVPTLYYALHNTSRVSSIAALAKERLPPTQSAAVMHGLKSFQICAENRNLVLHATVEYHPAPPPWVCFLKATSSKPGQVTEYDIPLSALREAAISMRELNAYHYALVDCITLGAEGEETPLPDRPPLPRKLSLHRIAEDR